MTFYDVKLQSVETPAAAKPSGIHQIMPMFISNTKLLYKPKSFFHCRPPLKVAFMYTSTFNE